MFFIGNSNFLFQVRLGMTAWFGIHLSDREGVTSSYSQHRVGIDLSDNEIEIRMKLVLIRDFPEDGVFFSVFHRNLALLYTSLRFVITNHISFCFKINMLHLLKMVKI